MNYCWTKSAQEGFSRTRIPEEDGRVSPLASRCTPAGAEAFREGLLSRMSRRASSGQSVSSILGILGNPGWVPEVRCRPSMCL